MQFSHGDLKLRDRVGDELRRIEDLVGIIKLVVAEPFEAVDLVAALDDLVQREAEPATVR